MSFTTRGFTGRGPERDDRLPPGQSLVHDVPVLSAGPTPDVDTADFTGSGAIEICRVELTGVGSSRCRECAEW